MNVFFLLTIVVCWDSGNGETIDYATLVTFGDSACDTGNAYRLSNGSWPPVPPFNSDGGWADDLLWNQILVEQFLRNASLENFACAGATTDNRLIQGLFNRNQTRAPGLRQQIERYIETKINRSIDFDRTLFVIWIGYEQLHLQSITDAHRYGTESAHLNQSVDYLWSEKSHCFQPTTVRSLPKIS